MSAVVRCSCGQAFANLPHLAGRAIPCPTCGLIMHFPGGAAYTATGSQGGMLVYWVCGGVAAVVLLTVAAAIGVKLTVAGTAKPLIADTTRDRVVGDLPAGSARPLPSPPVNESNAATPKTAERPGVFQIGPGVYELTVPGGERLEADERITPAGVTIAGGARLPSQVAAAEIRQNIDQFRRGQGASLEDVIVSWALIILAKPQEPVPNRNPNARPIQVNGLSGLEIRGKQGDLTWAFGFPDHTLIVSARGPADRVASQEIQSILHSLRRTSPIPAELAERARAVGTQ